MISMSGPGIRAMQAPAAVEGGADPTDPDFASVLALLDATQNAGDLSASNRPVNWSVMLTAKDVFNIAGVGAMWLADSADWNFAGDFTVEMFGVQFTDTSGVQVFFSHYNAVSPFSNNRSWIVQTDGAGNLQAVLNTAGTSGGNVTASGAWAPSTGVDYNICLERSGSTFRVYVDGAVIGSNTLAGTLFNNGDVLTIGLGRNGSAFANPLKGQFKAFRVTGGVARYGGAYTPPTLPLPKQ